MNRLQDLFTGKMQRDAPRGNVSRLRSLRMHSYIAAQNRGSKKIAPSSQPQLGAVGVGTLIFRSPQLRLNVTFGNHAVDSVVRKKQKCGFVGGELFFLPGHSGKQKNYL